MKGHRSGFKVICRPTNHTLYNYNNYGEMESTLSQIRQEAVLVLVSGVCLCMCFFFAKL